jgi:hypothetical protein
LGVETPAHILAAGSPARRKHWAHMLATSGSLNLEKCRHTELCSKQAHALLLRLNHDHCTSARHALLPGRTGPFLSCTGSRRCWSTQLSHSQRVRRGLRPNAGAVLSGASVLHDVRLHLTRRLGTHLMHKHPRGARAGATQCISSACLASWACIYEEPRGL